MPNFRFCPYCGKEILDPRWVACPFCGAAFAPAEQPIQPIRERRTLRADDPLTILSEASSDKARYLEAEQLLRQNNAASACNLLLQMFRDHPANLANCFGYLKAEICRNLKWHSENRINCIVDLAKNFHKRYFKLEDKPFVVLVNSTNCFAKKDQLTQIIKKELDKILKENGKFIQTVIRDMQSGKLNIYEIQSLCTAAENLSSESDSDLVYVQEYFRPFYEMIKYAKNNVERLQQHPCYSPQTLREIFNDGHSIDLCFDTFMIQSKKIHPYGYKEIKTALNEIYDYRVGHHMCLVCGVKLKIFSDICHMNTKHKAVPD